MIKVQNLVKKYGKEYALKGISFEVKEGDVLGFLGPNGAGKSTTMKIITGYMPPTSGDVFVDDRSVIEDPTYAQKKIGYLPETNPLYSDLMVWEYLEFIGEMRGLKGKKLKERMDYVIELVGLEENINKLIGHLSKGFKQRVGIAQSILHDPDILILDEPTVGLDPNQVIEIRNLIKEIGKEKTVILSSHILSEVEATTNRVVIINKGELVAQGTPEELVQTISEGEYFIVELEGEDKSEIENRFKSFSDIKSYKIEKQEEGWFRITLYPKRKDKNNGKLIFEFIKDNNLIIRELRREVIDLEDIFVQLTKN